VPLEKIATAVYCPACGKRMVLRGGKYGQFYGCSSYPRCRKIVNLRDAAKYNEPPKKTAVLETPSEYQKDIRDFVLHGDGNLVVEACPGSGKTTTNVWVGNDLPQRFLGLAFNVDIVKVWEEKASNGIIKTSHSFGLWTCRNHCGQFEIDQEGKKIYSILWPMVEAQVGEDAEKRELYGTVKTLVNLSKATLIQDVETLADRYGVPVNGDFGLVDQLVRYTLKQDREMTSLLDFGDMLWFPWVYHMRPPQFDMILGDEWQDMNRAQIELVLSALTPNGRIVVVGDRHQSLYGFRGADCDSIPMSIERLRATTLPLPISYRCPRAVVELAQVLVPEIKAAPWAKDGEVLYMSEERALAQVQAGDMILCRTNAPLVAPIYDLIRRGIKATIRGRDIGQGLVTFIEKFGAKAISLTDMLIKMGSYRDREVAKLLAQEKNGTAQNLNDKVETIFALSDGCSIIEELVEKTKAVFEEKRPSVVGSTVHRAKGLEADRVIIIRPDLMPHPMAKRDWELQQEFNCQYVAWTRAKNTLIFAEQEK